MRLIIYGLFAEGWDRFDDEFPLSNSVINLVVECLSFRETWLTRAPVPLVVKVLFGQRIEAFLQVIAVLLRFQRCEVSGFSLLGDFKQPRQP